MPPPRPKRRRVRASSSRRASRDDLSLRSMDDLDFLRTVWQDLSPRERLLRSWRMRALLADPEAAHDAKLWPRI